MAREKSSKASWHRPWQRCVQPLPFKAIASPNVRKLQNLATGDQQNQATHGKTIGVHWHVYSTDLYPKNPVQRTSGEWHIGKWKASVERDLICSAPLFTEPRESLDAQQPLPRWNSLSWLHLRLAPEVPHAKNGWGSSGLGWSTPERTLKTWKL